MNALDKEESKLILVSLITEIGSTAFGCPTKLIRDSLFRAKGSLAPFIQTCTVSKFFQIW